MTDLRTSETLPPSNLDMVHQHLVGLLRQQEMDWTMTSNSLATTFSVTLQNSEKTQDITLGPGEKK